MAQSEQRKANHPNEITRMNAPSLHTGTGGLLNSIGRGGMDPRVGVAIHPFRQTRNEAFSQPIERITLHLEQSNPEDKEMTKEKPYLSFFS